MEESNVQMLRLLSQALHGKPISPISQEQWPAILQELRYQGIFPLVAADVPKLGLSAQQLSEYRLLIRQHMRRFYCAMDTQRAAVECLHGAGIPVVVLKGAAAAAAYPQPDLRCMGDVDLLVPQEQFEAAFHALRAQDDFHTEQTPDKQQRHIAFQSRQGIALELHFYFSTSDSTAQNEVLDRALFDGIGLAVTQPVCGVATPMLPDLQNGLVLLAHINQHLRSGLGLRQIIDWMFYVQAHLDDAHWDAGFGAAAESIGMRYLAMVVTAMCQRYLGLSDKFNWCKSCQDDSICEELLDYILAHGNFGQKIASQSNTVSVVRLFRNPIHGLRAAQKSGLQTWNALQAHHWLKPFAWLYQMIRWIRHGTQNGVTLSGFAKSTQAERQETDFLRRLGVTRI